jgi:hypothetical protein
MELLVKPEILTSYIQWALDLRTHFVPQGYFSQFIIGYYPVIQRYIYPLPKVISKGKAILLQALTGPWDSRRLRLQNLKTIGT